VRTSILGRFRLTGVGKGFLIAGVPREGHAKMSRRARQAAGMLGYGGPPTLISSVSLPEAAQALIRIVAKRP
jgi:hypothetical protein